MKIQFFDREDNNNPRNGTTLSDVDALLSLLKSLRSRPPFVCELQAENGFKLMIGIGRDYGFVQYSSADDEPPYVTALGRCQSKKIWSLSVAVPSLRSCPATAYRSSSF